MSVRAIPHTSDDCKDVVESCVNLIYKAELEGDTLYRMQSWVMGCNGDKSIPQRQLNDSLTTLSVDAVVQRHAAAVSFGNLPA